MSNKEIVDFVNTEFKNLDESISKERLDSFFENNKKLIDSMRDFQKDIFDEIYVEYKPVNKDE